MLAQRNAGRRAAGIRCIRSADHACHEILDQLLRIERLARSERRTGRFALAALDAGIEAQQLVPAKLHRLADAVFLRIERGHLERRRRHDVMFVALAREALLTRMEREMQQTCHRVLHRTAARRAKGHRERARRDQQRDDDRERTRHRAGRQRDEQRETERERSEQQRQAVPRAAREPRGHGLRAMPAAPDEHRADEHDQGGEKDQLVEPRRVDREAVVDEHERHREDRAARRRDVRLRDIRIARNHMMQVDEIALRDRQQVGPAVGARGGGPPFAPIRRPLRDRKGESGHRYPQQDGDDKHGAHRQKSLQRRSAS